NGATPNMTPVSPAIRNWNRKPQQKSMGVARLILPPYIVASQLKILMPVGMATNSVAAAKKVLEMDVMPTVNIWWAHTPMLMNPMATVAPTIAGLPKIGFRENTGTTSDMMAKAGKIKIYTSG